MLTEFLNRLLELKQEPVTDVGAVHYWTSSGNQILPPLQKPLEFRTLTGMVDYLLSGLDILTDDIEDTDLAIHVVSHERVDLVGTCDPTYKTRQTLARSVCGSPQPKFRDWLDQEAFSIFVQSEFMATPERAELLAMVGVLDAEDVRTAKDDGVTQTISARKGVVLRERKTIPNPILLAPYRTFREIDQPESLFVLRVREGSSTIQLALFPADGDAWSLTAMQSIKTWLSATVTNKSIPILA